MKVLGPSLLLVVVTALAGCESSGSGYSSTTHVSVGYYHGSGWHDPYYRNRCCYNGGVVVRPPAHRPPGNRPPHARPLPSRPRPATRPARRR